MESEKLTVNSKVDDLNDGQVDLIEKSLNTQWGQTDFKSEHFVGNSQIHPYAKLRQYMMELRTREEVCETMEYQMKMFDIKVKISEQVLETETNELRRLQAELELLENKKDFMMHKRRMKDCYRERKQYVRLIEDFINSKENTLPDGRKISEHFDDPDFAAEMEKEYWTVRLAKQVALDFAAYGRPGTGNLDSILMLNGEQQNKVLGLASDLFVRVEARNNALINNASKKMQLGYKNDYLAKLAHVEMPTQGMELLENN